MIEALIQQVNNTSRLCEAELDLIKRSFVTGRFSKGSMLEAEGTRTKNLYFIVNGFIRSFHYETGEDITTNIRGANSLITAFNGFVNDSLADSSIQCITACDVLSISNHSYKHLIAESISWKNFCHSIYEQEIIFNQKRTRELLTKTAESRYLQLLKDYPGIGLHVPVQYIATYLGIKPESLSRIRKKVIS
ncbi:Crp/Fnr family transcriptional regulator [Pedobacter sp. SYSU D00535]|uniref:Crp/Fnr family transcriptional regulator n=1 Tax=Pedobacter sp. SYSU D00535 TaxID=2810308 RepID=UPI001A975B5D|nr:Crp/Fnr family transcriptional regulator [Pedobacter sp. SYSU D00535]